MKKYIESISELNNIALSSTLDEVERFSESDMFWTKHKSGNTTQKTIRKGDIFQFEFGKSYVPEMAYEHRGLVIGIAQNLLYVLPIYSYKPTSAKEMPAHIIDNPNERGSLYLLKKREFPFLQHDSVIKLNDLRTVSKARIKYSHHASIAPETETFQFIEKVVFRNYFPTISYAYDQLKKDYERVLKENQELKRQIKE